MPSATVQRLTHRGHVEASALLFDPALIGEREALLRVLALWTPGAVLRRLPTGELLLRLTPSRRMDCRTAWGTPLVSRAGRLVGVPLTEAEWSRLAPAPEAILFARAGVVEVVAWASTAAEDPSLSIDLSSVTPVEVFSLGPLPAEPVLAVSPPLDAREALGSRIPPPSPEQVAWLAAVVKTAPQSGAPRSGPPTWVGRALLWIFGGWSAQTRGGPRPQTSSPAWWQRLERWARRLTQLSGVSRLLGRRQARYLGKVLELFEERDLTEALRHAIPLGGGNEAGGPPLLGIPGRRATLRITPGTLGAGGSLDLGPTLYGHLQQTYRQAVQRLERRGELEQAAFVLAELLQASEEAVSFLERHGKRVEAARLAESRALSPGLVVRQWFVAGNPARAMEVARFHNAYADAVSRLQKSRPQEAAKLRLLWANALAEAGNYAQAAEVLWQVEGARGLCANWLDRTILLGGPAGARALVRKLSLDPEAFAEVRRAAQELLDDTSADRLAERWAFASELVVPTGAQVHPGFPEMARTLGRAALRALVRDGGLYGTPGPRAELERITRYVGDGELKADLPRWTGPDSGVKRGLPERIRVPASEAGSMPIRDVGRLPSGRLLVALGEAGVRLLAPDGRVVREVDVPADRLVIAQNGARAIALARRGALFRLSRIDLLTGAASHWCDAELTVWADSYDGNVWFAANFKRVFAVDPLAEELRALWQIPEAVPVLAMSQPGASFSFIGNQEVWTLQLEGFALRGRAPLSLALPALEGGTGSLLVPSAFPMAVDPLGTTAITFIAPHSQARPTVVLKVGNGAVFQFPGEQLLFPPSHENLSLQHLAFVKGCVALCTEGELARVRLLDPASQRVRCEVILEGVTRAVIRATPEGLLLVADDRGRIVILDPSGGVPRQLRV